METKKNPKANLENYSKLFIQLGLVLALLVVFLGIEFKTFDVQIDELGVLNMGEEIEEDIPITERIEQIKPPPPPPPAPEVIEVVEDEAEVEEVILANTESDENEVVEVEKIEEVVEEEVVEEDVPFAIIEDAPIFPGCKGNKKQLRECLQEKIKKHVYKKFNNSLAGELDLDPGKKKIYVQFKIDKKGNIVDVRARGPHKRLEKEGIKVVKSLPKMIPGKQRGRPVGVKYTLPITLAVE